MSKPAPELKYADLSLAERTAEWLSAYGQMDTHIHTVPEAHAYRNGHTDGWLAGRTWLVDHLLQVGHKPYPDGLRPVECAYCEHCGRYAYGPQIHNHPTRCQAPAPSSGQTDYSWMD